jgi:regulatory protein YycI of two-component signal transduction system YycFG
MDWNKAKTILIIGFIMIDAFLFTQVYDIRPDLVKDIDPVIQVLNERGIEIEAEISSSDLSLPLLEVEYEIYDRDSTELVKFLGDGYYEIKPDEHYRNDDSGSIQISDGKKLVLQLRKTEFDYNLDQEKAFSLVQEFIEDYSMDMENYGEMNPVSIDGVYNITFNEMYGDYSLENSYVTFIVDGKGVAGFEEQKINTVRESQGTVSITKVEEAILRLLRYDDISGHVLKEVKICYYDDEAGEDWKNIVKDTVDPTWKAVFDSGIIKYLIETE